MIKLLQSRRAWLIGLLLASAFIVSHPYIGIRHDGILYLGEALLDVDPGRMANDLFFVFGSQASFTIVPHVYAQAIRWFGVGDGTLYLLALSLSLYFIATCWLDARLVPRDLFAWSVLCIFVGAPVYGGERVFAYGETFFTARSLAEPIVLAGVGLLLRGRVFLAIAAMVAALFVHPLIALPGLMLAWCWLVGRDRRWLWTLLLLVVPIGFGMYGIAPFIGLFQRYDAEWLDIVEKATPFVFPLKWTIGDWGTVAFDVFVLAWIFTIGRTASWPSARIAIAALISGVLGIGVSIVAADLLNNVLLTGLQVWRAHWLMHWVAMAVAPVLFWQLWARGTFNARSAALCIVASFFCLTSLGPIALMGGAVLLVRYERRAPVSKAIVQAFGALCVALLVLLLLRQVAALTAFIGLLEGSLPVQISRVLSITLVTIAFVALGVRQLPQARPIAMIMSVLLLGLAVAGWDQREKWTRYQEEYLSNRPLLWADVVGARDRVYWFREVRAPWLLMHHANYYSPNQASGVLFNRRTAVELDARAKATGLLEFQETVCRAMNGLNKEETSCEPDIEVVRDICTSADLSFVVLQSVLPVKPAGVLDTGFVEHEFKKTFYLYRCSDIPAS